MKAEKDVGYNLAEIARRYGLSRARVTQIMNLLDLPDEIQEYVMALPPREHKPQPPLHWPRLQL